MSSRWKELKNGDWRLELGLFSIRVFWEKKVSRGSFLGWKYKFLEYESKFVYKTSNEAKEYAVMAAREQFLKALELLGL